MARIRSQPESTTRCNTTSPQNSSPPFFLQRHSNRCGPSAMALPPQRLGVLHRIGRFAKAKVLDRQLQGFLAGIAEHVEHGPVAVEDHAAIEIVEHDGVARRV